MHKHLKRDKHRGVTLVFAALWMGIALAALMVLDIGNLVWQKRELQKIADLSALSGASGDIYKCSEIATEIALLNGAIKEEVVIAQPLKWIPGESPPVSAINASTNADACHIRIERVVNYFFIFKNKSDSRKIVAFAIAAQKNKIAAVHVRSSLLSLNSADSKVLNAIIGGLLGGSLNIDAVGWQGIAATQVNLLQYLELLALKLNLNVGDYDELLGTDIKAGVLLDVMLDLIKKDADTVSAAVTALEKLKIAANISNLKISLGDLLSLGSGGARDAMNLSLNVFELIQAFLQVGNGSNAIDLSLDAFPVLTVLPGMSAPKVSLTLIEKPKWKIGNPDTDSIEAETAQLKLKTSLYLTLAGHVTNIWSGLGLDLELKAGGAKVKMLSYSCENGEKSMTLEASSALVELNLTLEVGIAIKNKIGPINVLISPKSKATVNLEKPGITPKSLDVNLQEEDWIKVVSDFKILENIIDNLKSVIGAIFDNKPGGGVINGLLGFLGSLIIPLVDAVLDLLALIASPLDHILDRLLKLLGLDLAVSQVAGQLNCGGGVELVY